MTRRSGPRPLALWKLLGLLAVLTASVTAQDKSQTEEKKDTAGQGKPDEKKGDDKKPAKPGEPEPVRCQTADGVELIGDFYRPPDSIGKRAPCVVLLHAVGPNRETASRKDFGELPKKLQKEGYAVLTFDFRGYGESKNVDPRKYLRAHRSKFQNAESVPRKVDGRNFKTPQDLAELVNDLVAIKIHLDQLNNEGLCNAHMTGVVGIEQGAMIGLLWLFNENVDENRVMDPRQLRMGGLVKYEGEDIAGVVWISLNGKLGASNINRTLSSVWLAKIRDQRTATLAFYGANDKDCKVFWDTGGAAKIVKPEKELYDTTDVKRLKNTNLSGYKLLDSAAFDVEKDIFSFLNTVLMKPKKLWQEHKGGSRDATMVDLRHIFGG